MRKGKKLVDFREWDELTTDERQFLTEKVDIPNISAFLRARACYEAVRLMLWPLKPPRKSAGRPRNAVQLREKAADRKRRPATKGELQWHYHKKIERLKALRLAWKIAREKKQNLVVFGQEGTIISGNNPNKAQDETTGT